MIRNSVRNLCLAFASFSLALVPSQLLAAWTFTLTNSTSTPIVSIEAREAGTSEWGSFSGGLAAGETATFEWGASTENSSCDWEIRANFSDGSTSDPATFDFCKSTDLVF
jgi:hypothetical protein